MVNAMTVDVLRELLADMPGDAELWIDTGLSVNAICVDDDAKVEYDDDNDVVFIIL
jgi:hypothetical protein